MQFDEHVSRCAFRRRRLHAVATQHPACHQNQPGDPRDGDRAANRAKIEIADAATRLREIFPHALIYKMYGLTECKRVSYLAPELAESKPGSVGKAIPGTEVYLLSADGQRTAPGETGTLYVRGPHVMRGYWNRPELSARMLKPGPLPGEMVLCTQDQFRMDAEGFLYFVGRSDDIIKTRGEKVSPKEVENALYALPGVQDAAVVGQSDPMLGQAIRAFLVLTEGTSYTSREVVQHCASRLESFMVPKFVTFVSSVPKTPSGKITKKNIWDHATGARVCSRSNSRNWYVDAATASRLYTEIIWRASRGLGANAMVLPANRTWAASEKPQLLLKPGMHSIRSQRPRPKDA